MNKSLIKVLVCHPGPTLTDLQIKTSTANTSTILDRYILNHTMKRAHSAEDGAQGIIYCCAASNVESGQFYGPCGENGKPTSKTLGQTGPVGLLPSERSPVDEELLWNESISATGAVYSF